MMKNIFKSEFYRNVVTLMTGTAIAQLIPILITPFLTRLYSPDDIGFLSIYVSYITIGSIISTLRYDQALLLPRSNKVSLDLFIFILFFSIFFFFLSGFILLIMYLFDFHLSGLPYFIMFLIPFAVLLQSILQSYSVFINRSKKYKQIAISKITQNSVNSTGQLVLFSSNFGLYFARIFGLLSALVYYFIFDKIHLFRVEISFKRIKENILKYKDFPFYSFPNALLNSSSNQLPMLILGYFFNASFLGFFSLSQRMISAPLGIFTSSLSQVFYKKTTDIIHSNDKLYPFVKKTYFQLFKIAIFPFFFLFVLSPELFSYIFGSEWEVSGVYARYLIPWYFLVFLNSPITSIINVLNKQKTYLIFEFTLFVLRFSVMMSAFVLDFDIIIMLYGIIGFLYHIFLFFYLLKIAKND